MSRIDEIIERLTLREKIGQLTQIPFTSKNKNEVIEKIRRGEAGSVILCDTPFAGNDELEAACAEEVNEIQKVALEEGNGIPIISGRDVIHGYGIIFPIPLGVAATFNMNLTEELFRYMAGSAAAEGIHWTFGPMIDISRDPRWGRIAESPGEDSYLGEQFARAAVRGIQGEDPSLPGNIAACAKHFIGYGDSEGGRDYSSTEISDYTLRNVYLRAFKGAIDEGMLTVMSSFNEISGQPVTSSKYLLTDLLKKELGFKGLVVSDWGSVEQLQNHCVAKNKAECAELAINAGLDIDMSDGCYEENLESLVKSGKVSEEKIDEAVRRVLYVKERLGLFERPYVDFEKPNQEEFLQLAKQAAVESAILLKNENNILPLKKNSKILVTGPLAHLKTVSRGCWSPDTDFELFESAIDALKRTAPDVSWTEWDIEKWGLPFTSGLCYDIDAIDAVVMLIGETRRSSGEAISVSNIEIPPYQQELIKQAQAFDKPIIAVVMAGRPLALGSIIKEVDAVLYVFHGGTKGSEAIADLLFGNANPSGRLPVSIPRVTGQIPLYYSIRPSARAVATYYGKGNFQGYGDCIGRPLYPFGYGLSYTEFEYSNVRSEMDEISLSDIKNGKKIKVYVDVKNVGERIGNETVQCYVCDVMASMVRPVKELRGFKKVEINPREKITVYFELGMDELGFYNNGSKFVVEAGEFEIYIGKDALDEAGKIILNVV